MAHPPNIDPNSSNWFAAPEDEPGHTHSSISSAGITIGSSVSTASTAATAVGSLVQASGAGLQTLTVDPTTVGDLLVLAINNNYASGPATSVSGGGVTTWQRLGVAWNGHNQVELLMGVVTATGSSVITIVESTGSGGYIGLACQQFTAGTPVTWTTDGVAQDAIGSGTSGSYGSLTPATSNELYVGALTSGTGTTGGSYSGFTYDSTFLTYGQLVFDPTCSATVNPSFTQTNGSWAAVSVLIQASLPLATLPVRTLNPINTTLSSVTVPLPTGEAAGTIFAVEKSDSSAHTITLTGSIGGTSSALVVTGAQQSASFVADVNGSWWLTAGSQPTSSLDSRYVLQTSEPAAFTNAYGGLVAPGTPANSYQPFTIQSRPNSLTVPVFRPVGSPATLALDLMPNGAPLDGGNGFTWFDVCDSDVQNSTSGEVGTARVAVHATTAEFGTYAYNSSPAKSLILTVNSGTTALQIDPTCDVFLGEQAALATTATAGFVSIPSSAGTPTGTPAVIKTGLVPIEIDTTNGRLWAYYGGAWHYAALT